MLITLLLAWILQNPHLAEHKVGTWQRFSTPANARDLKKGEILGWCVEMGMRPHELDKLAQILGSPKAARITTVFNSGPPGREYLQPPRISMTFFELGIEVEYEAEFPSLRSNLKIEHLEGGIGP